MTTAFATPDVDMPTSVTHRFLGALARRAFPEVADTLAPNVWMRAMLVREIREAHDVAATIALLEEWFAAAESFEIRELEHATVEGRQRLRWQFVLRPAWAPGTPHRIEQVGYAAIHRGRISRLDVVCTGFHPLT